MIAGDMNREQELTVLSLLAKLNSISEFHELLNVVVNELPDAVGALGCSIYLLPEYVPKFKGILLRNGRDIQASEVVEAYDEYIVLAATNYSSLQSMIGKAYFGSGEGVTGWCYQQGKPVRIVDLRNQDELHSYSWRMEWVNAYDEGVDLYAPEDKRRLLAVPLIDEDPIGVMKFHATRDKKPFSDIAERVALVVAQIISGFLRQKLTVNRQSQSILHLIEVSNKQHPLDVIAEVTREMKNMLNCSKSQYYARNPTSSQVRLVIENGETVSPEHAKSFSRGQSLVGWVFKTGRPLLLQDIKECTGGLKLDASILARISDGVDVNEEDQVLKNDEPVKFYTNRFGNTISLLAVPVKSNDGSVDGVLCAYSSAPGKLQLVFDRTQLQLGLSFASTIALALENERQRKLGGLLTDLGNITNLGLLFRTVIQKVPQLVSSAWCSIYTVKSPYPGSGLVLVETDRKGLRGPQGELIKISYELGEGKTGFCAQNQSVLVVNNYGTGKVAQLLIEKEKQRIVQEHPHDLCEFLLDKQQNQIGLVRLLRRENSTFPFRAKFRTLVRSMMVEDGSIPSNKVDPLVQNEDKTRSFLAVPIKSDTVLHGVITLSRPVAGLPFSQQDIELLETIARRLSSVINNLQEQKRREQLLITLAHEINTPLVAILADSENLSAELSKKTELYEIARHSMEQVLRLHMQTRTILAVLTEKNIRPTFAEHSIYRPLKEACEMFESEASQKGCDISGPKPIGEGFPKIEMSLADLTIAFKNLIHNAIKYSFSPPARFETHRYVKIWGQWDNDRRYYNISIQNYGVGIENDEIKKGLIFKPYYRGVRASDRHRTGAGFGLAYARQVIEDLHQGSISVTSVPQQAANAFLTTFVVRLPVKQS